MKLTPTVSRADELVPYTAIGVLAHHGDDQDDPRSHRGLFAG